jgi:S-adenosylmethionine:tRNA ribosyltransferase-isomerase
MKLADFNYDYPKELVAQRPLPERDASRMMLLDRAAKKWRHARVADLPAELRAGDLLVVNDTQVVPARLFGKRCTGESLEVLVVEPAGPDTWRCLLKKAKRIRDGEKFFFGMQATAVAHGREGIFLLLEFKPGQLELAMKHHGVPPLPPYIEREGHAAYTAEDRERYQTVFARKAGSAAAPTAGLHLSENLLAAIAERGIEVAHVTLHVGIDTFAPVRAEDTAEHRMHGERYEIPEQAAAAITKAKEEGRRVVAVGTTTTRALESAALREPGAVIAGGEAVTDLFITPGFEFRVVDAMLTNFHQPKSTLLMLVSAFAGRELILAAYDEAIREGYRLFSYGDAMLII